MKDEAIQQLNQLNKKFYNRVASHFDTSRQFYWHGWNRLLPHLTDLAERVQPIRVLDIGCGNARFASFLADALSESQIEYHGIDFNAQLLQAAEHRLAHFPHKTTLSQVDIVVSLLNKQPLVSELSFDLIVIFGVLHHIPSYQLRKTLLQVSADLLVPNGLLCCTLWRFLDQEKTEHNTLSPEEIHVNKEELEPHDYFVSWERGVTATRYCHFTPDYEEERLIAASELKLMDNFESDGKEGKGNKYLVFKKLI